MEGKFCIYNPHINVYLISNKLLEIAASLLLFNLARSFEFPRPEVQRFTASSQVEWVLNENFRMVLPVVK